MEIKIVNKSNNELPHYSTELSAGMDVRAFLKEPVVLKPFDRTIIPTGLYLEIPAGFEAQIRPRSGMAYKYGITVLNSPGTIDADYRGEVGIILANMSNEAFEIKSGDRICQMVIAKHESIVWTHVEELTDTTRGAGGFGSTGKK